MKPQPKTKTFIGFKPTDYQKDVIKLINTEQGKGTIISVLSPRQCGKSLMNENILLMVSINNKNAISIYMCPTYKQLIKVFKEMMKAIIDSGIVKNSNASDMTIDFINGSKIIFLTGGQRENIRGYTVKNGGILVIDEASFISDEIFYEGATPFTRVFKAVTLLTSTPKYKIGFFYSCYSKGNIYQGFKSINFTDYNLERFLDADTLLQAKTNLPNAIFTTEYLGQFLDDGSTVFGAINECIYDTIEDTTAKHIGIDWSLGGGSDNTVITTLNDNCQVIEQYIINNLNPTAVVDEVANILNNLGSHRINCQAELNSIGTVYFDLLQQKINSNIILTGFNTSNNSKSAIVNKMQIRVNNKEVGIPNDPLLISELNTFTAKYNPKTRVVTYNATEGCHDDRVMSLLIAIDCFEQSLNSWGYSF